jgi:hypothetical protein
MIVRTVIRLLILAGLPAIACGPGVEEGPVVELVSDSDGATGTETGDDSAPGDTASGTGTEGETDTGQETEGETGTGEEIDSGTDSGAPTPCADEVFNNEKIFGAMDLLENGRFVAMSVECLLLREEVTGGTRTMVVFTDPWATGGVGSAVEMVSAMAPKAITCHPDYREAIVLFDTGGGSALYEVTEESGAFTALGDGEAFDGLTLTGIKRLRRTSNGRLNRVCAFGQGIVCADASLGLTAWETAVAFDVSGDINDLGLTLIDGAWSIVAVGPGGRILVESGDGWRLLNSGTTAELFAVSATEDTITAAGQGGVFVHGTIDGLTPRVFLEGDVVSLYWWSDRFLKGVTRDGTVFEGQMVDGALTLCSAAFELAEPVSASILLSCGNEEDYLIMTETLVLGTYDCSSIVVV